MVDGPVGIPDSSPEREDSQCLTRSSLSSSCSVSSALSSPTSIVTPSQSNQQTRTTTMWTCKQGCKLKSVVWSIRATASASYRLPANSRDWNAVPLGRAIRGSKYYEEQEGPVCEVCSKRSEEYFKRHRRYIQNDIPEFSYFLEWIEE